MLRISLSEFLLLHMESTNQTKINYQMNRKNENTKKIYFNTNHLKSPKMIACSTILYRFNNLHLVGHNCLRISNTSDVPEFIKSCLIHHPPIYNWPFQTSSAFNITFIKITKHIITSFLHFKGETIFDLFGVWLAGLPGRILPYYLTECCEILPSLTNMRIAFQIGKLQLLSCFDLVENVPCSAEYCTESGPGNFFDLFVSFDQRTFFCKWAIFGDFD